MSCYIPIRNLPKLKEYKYQSEDRSLLTKYFLKRFWIEFEKIFPLWMAPNMVTLLGLVFNIVALAVVFYYDPNFDQPSPSWTYYFYGFCIFMYQTFDACDGIHARKTGQSGPLGELFDHCCDAINTTLSVLVFASVCGFGKGLLLYTAQFATLTNFYLSTWETFYTHRLFLSEFSGPVEGIILIIVTCCLTGYRGQDNFWGFELFTVDLSGWGLAPEFDSYTVDLLTFSMFGAAIMIIYNIYAARRNVINKLQDPEEKKNANLGLILFFLYYASVFGLVFLHSQIFHQYATQMVFSVGATMAFVVGRIILNHLTKQGFPYLNLPMVIPSLQILAIEILTKFYRFNYDDVIALVVYVGMGITLATHGCFVFEIIYDITDYLDIWALSIKHPQTKKTD
ncbi:DEKNAAC101327 [Brettanomyces naardenensis]|uniref:DEKNAAC101327 n=1 Tax=Brettanomyces naardenensis TaxID=13370 RepID=A0A448YHN9_BRENA|nr:DEKNAAC101327 [Brettanomyces naardenensis]